jgi:Reverse transcriptase (RNA-dependent DNA polymerase)
LLLLDLSSASDTVDHTTLLGVLMLTRQFSVERLTLNWFSSYRDFRTQAYHYDGRHSELYAVNTTVPQGSVLGSQKFIAYTEQLAGLIDSFHLSHYLYADDMQLVKIMRIAEVGSTILSLQQCIDAIHRRRASRRLQLNPSQTEAT